MLPGLSKSPMRCSIRGLCKYPSPGSKPMGINPACTCVIAAVGAPPSPLFIGPPEVEFEMEMIYAG